MGRAFFRRLKQPARRLTEKAWMREWASRVGAAVWEGAGALLAPGACAACGERVGVMTAFCSTCAQSVVPVRARGEHASGFAYGGALARALVAFKYDPRPDLARPLGALLARSAAAMVGDPPSLVVPVPLHVRRLRERGFNQAALLAAPVARHLGVPLAARGLLRTRDTGAQALLDRSSRATNVLGAFRASGRPAVERLNDVLVIDDVRTTGATLKAAADALRAAGARRVRTLTLAIAVDAVGQPM